MAPDKPPVRLTRRTRRILLVLLSGAGNLGSYAICRAAAIPLGTIYPVLVRLESAGWAEGEWGPLIPGTPLRRRYYPLRRRYYRLTPKGRYQALALLHLEEGRGCDRG